MLNYEEEEVSSLNFIVQRLPKLVNSIIWKKIKSNNGYKIQVSPESYVQIAESLKYEG